MASGLVGREPRTDTEDQQQFTRSLEVSRSYDNPPDDFNRSLGFATNNNVNGQVLEYAANSSSSTMKPVVPPPDTLSRWNRFRSGVTVEPAIFFHIMVIAIEATVMSNLIIHKICAQSLHLPDSLCLYNMSNGTVQEHVQVEAANLEMYITLANTLPSFLVAIFMGAYSDRRGRKFPIIFPVVGCIVSSALFAIFAYYDEMPASFLCLATIPRAIGGGLIAFNSSCLSYVVDNSTQERRTERVAMVEASLFLGTPFGTLLGGNLASYNVWYAFVVGFVMDVVVVIYLLAVIRNPPQSPDQNNGLCQELKDFFQVGNVKLTFATLVKRREGNARKYIILMLIAMFPAVIAFIGTTSIMYLFVRMEFSWDILTYSYYSVTTIVAVAFGLILSSVVVARIFKVSDAVLAICGGFCGIVHNMVVGFATNSMQMYLAVIPATFSGTSMLAVRSMISKLIPTDEQGKVFAVSASLEAAVPLFTSVVYTQLYTATLTVFPQSCFILSASILLIPLFIMSYLHYDMKVRNVFPKSGYIRIESSNDD